MVHSGFLFRTFYYENFHIEKLKELYSKYQYTYQMDSTLNILTCMLYQMSVHQSSITLSFIYTFQGIYRLSVHLTPKLQNSSTLFINRMLLNMTVWNCIWSFGTDTCQKIKFYHLTLFSVLRLEGQMGKGRTSLDLYNSL